MHRKLESISCMYHYKNKKVIKNANHSALHCSNEATVSQQHILVNCVLPAGSINVFKSVKHKKFQYSSE